MRFLLSTAVLIALVPLHSAIAQSQLHGRTFDVYTQTPVAEVAISSGADQTTSDARGRFTLPCTGQMTITLRRVGYAPLTQTVDDCSAVLQIGLVPGGVTLNAVKVIASQETSALEAPRSVTVLSREELTRSTGLFLEEALNLTPGLRMEKRTMSGGQRITIRGYGQGSNFNGSGYKAYLNGIPITDAEGVTILDDIDFATVGRVDVIRGPASSRYGTGIGGVVNMFTIRPDAQTTTATQEVLTGSDGLVRTNTRFASASSGASLLFNYGHQEYDSYRIHSGSTKEHAILLGDFRPSADRTVSTFLSYSHSYDQRAGQLDSAAFFAEENAGESRYLNNDAHADLETVRAGVSHGYRFSDRVSSLLTAYYSGGTTDDAFAVGLNIRSAQNFGGRAVLTTSVGGDRLPAVGSTGIEYQKTNTVAKSYALADMVLGAMRSDLETHASQASLFTQWDLGLPAQVTLTAGASVNFIEYEIADRLANSSNPSHLDASGHKSFDPVITPSISLRKLFGSTLSAYVSMSQGYSPPTSDDAVIPFTGEANEGLKPERATMVEVGTKGSLFDRRLSFQLALFDMRVTDKLTTQGVFEGGTQLYSYTVNAGDQDNRGLELSMVYSLIDRPDRTVSLVRPFLTYTYSDFEYDDFRSDANDDAGTIDYSGNEVVGVPASVLNAGVDVRLRSGAYFDASYQYVDDMPLTYDNQHHAPSFSLVKAKVGIARDLGERLRLDAFLGGNNLTSSLHYTMVFLNGNYSGGTSPSIYLPGPYEATFFGGASVGVRF